MLEIVTNAIEPNDKPPWRIRIYGEVIFCRALIKKFRFRILFFLLVLFTGGLLFKLLNDEPTSYWCGVYYTWWLIFGEATSNFPKSPLLRAVTFIVPLLGLLVLIETFIELSMFFRDRRRSEKEWCKLLASEMSDHVVLVGFGKLGYRTYNLLHKMNQPVVVIELNDQSPFLESPRSHRAPVFVGDARHDHMLMDANVARARSIICCTSDDLVNLEVALDARRMQPKIRVVMRMFDQNLADKIREGFNIHVAFSTTAMSAPSFAAAAYDHTIQSSIMVEGEILVTSRIRIEAASALGNATVAQVMGRLPMNIVAHRRAGESTQVFPHPEIVIRPNDTLLVQLRFDDLAKLHALNQSGP